MYEKTVHELTAIYVKSRTPITKTHVQMQLFISTHIKELSSIIGVEVCQEKRKVEWNPPSSFSTRSLQLTRRDYLCRFETVVLQYARQVV